MHRGEKKESKESGGTKAVAAKWHNNNHHAEGAAAAAVEAMTSGEIHVIRQSLFIGYRKILFMRPAFLSLLSLSLLLSASFSIFSPLFHFFPCFMSFIPFTMISYSYCSMINDIEKSKHFYVNEGAAYIEFSLHSFVPMAAAVYAQC